MNATMRRLTLLAFGTLIGTGCASYTVPLAAHQGSTVGIPLGSEIFVGNLAGYAMPGISDQQRGQLVFRLLDDQTELPTGYFLDLRAITRVYPDPASLAGVNNNPAPAGVGLAVGIGQVLAVLDVPDTAPTGDFLLEVTRERPAGNELPAEETPSYRLPFTILPGLEDPHPGQGFLNVSGTSFLPIGPVPFTTIYPNPKVVFDLPTPAPAAAHLVVSYPGSKIYAVLSVFEEQHLGRQSIVLFSDDTAQEQITIDLADPLESGVTQFSIAFQPKAGAALVDPTDFTVVEEFYYDADGLPMGGSSTPLLIR